MQHIELLPLHSPFMAAGWVPWSCTKGYVHQNLLPLKSRDTLQQ